MPATKYKIHIDTRAYRNKPTQAIAIDIGKRITRTIKELTPQEIAEMVGGNGQTMLLAEMNGKRLSENMVSQTIVALDFDNSRSDFNENNYTSINQILQDVFIQQNASFIYKTFNHSEDCERFRVVFFLDRPLTNNDQVKAVYEWLMERYPNADKNTKDSSRMFYGGKGFTEIDFNNQLDTKQISIQKPIEKTYTPSASVTTVSDKEAIELITDYAERNKENLLDYEFYLNCSFVLKHNQNLGIISPQIAESCLMILANNNPRWEVENVQRFRADKSEPRIKKHLSEWFSKYEPDNVQKKETEEDKFLTKPERALQIVEELAEELYYTNENLAYAKIPFQGKMKIKSITSQTFKSWLVYIYQQKEGKILTDSDFRTVVTNLNSKAEMVGTRKDIYLRIAEVDGAIYLDLCNENEQVLEITKDGFTVLNDSPVLFKQNEDMAEIPIPILEDNNDYKRLKKYLNVKNEDDFNMIVAFILSSFRQNIPKPILNLTGEAGTGKSTNTRIIRQFTDPAKLKSLLKKEINTSEIQVAAYTQYLLAFDNLSGVSAEGSDLLCTMSTGGATTKRKLYADTEEIIIDLKKSVILNGIDEISKRPDLVSRTIFIETPKLNEASRKTEHEIWEGFKQDYPYILGSLVNAVSTGLKNKGESTSTYSRLLDFGRYVEECSPTLNWKKDDWKRVYSENQNIGIQNSIESDPFISNLIGFIHHRRSLQSSNLPYSETATTLIKELIVFSGDYEADKSKAWPKSNQIKTRLKRSASLLESENITWDTFKTNGQMRYVISIEE